MRTSTEMRRSARTIIGAHVSIGYEVQIGADCYFHPSSVIRERCQIGDRVILQPGAVIGSCGFGYTPDDAGRHQKLEQLGIVILEDDVEIGANTTIDRSRFKATIIRKGSKIDNLCQIAHNVEIGEHNVIAAQTGIAGSSKTGKYVMLGGQVGIVGHVELKTKSWSLAAAASANRSKKANTAAAPPSPLTNTTGMKYISAGSKSTFERIKELEAQVKPDCKTLQITIHIPRRSGKMRIIIILRVIT